MNDLVFALLDNSDRFECRKAARQARELSIAFTRFKYDGPIFEDSDPDRLLSQASAFGTEYCLILPFGCFLAEVWLHEEVENPGIMSAIEAWARVDIDLAGGVFDDDSADKPPFDPLLLLVNLDQYRKAGGPPWKTVVGHARGSLAPDRIGRNLVHLDPRRCGQWMSTLDGPAADEAPASADEVIEIDQPGPANGARFLDKTRRLTENLERAVFVWNIESYRDIEAPSSTFVTPLSALYTVAAGFKPNRILNTHGATESSRMVVFDYSERGLEYRRLLHEEWDGVDYPAFLRMLFQTLPSSDTHYLLWDGVEPENLDWALVERRWRQEIEAWGGEQALRDHWRIFRKMKVEYLHCDLLKEPERLLERIEDESGSLIWWSNAFLSIHSIWHYSAAQRRALYLAWIQGLAECAPQIHIFGSDCNNVSLNAFTAREYARWLDGEKPDPLDILQPRGLNRLQMRY